MKVGVEDNGVFWNTRNKEIQATLKRHCVPLMKAEEKEDRRDIDEENNHMFGLRASSTLISEFQKCEE